ncbi:myb/SANT-like DNA-binding domain-containing protein 2 [Chelonia mydas]|uniref:myb/SANT-like DNA-binding domain-containing protein 2 n=1 Tax=Chelonia mydas TaxID=8469 RepID=UPI001CA9DAAE|nr:myb/SANT-like DNA-binding domain-containing protein 2 [Chelonia mydas]
MPKYMEKISKGMKDRGYNRDPQQCRVKIKELRQAYQKSKEANSRSGSDPQRSHFYDELHAILGAPHHYPTPVRDSCKGGVSCKRGEDLGDEEDGDAEEDETVLPNSQELFITLETVPTLKTDLEGGEGSSAANVSALPHHLHHRG